MGRSKLWVFAGALALAAGVIVWLALRPDRSDQAMLARIRQAHAAGAGGGAVTTFELTYPRDGTIFPQDFAPPTFVWKDDRSQLWLVAVDFAGGDSPLEFLARSRSWQPDPAAWETIKGRSLDSPCRISVLGWGERPEGGPTLSKAAVAISTSRDAVGAPIFYREVNLPFIDAVTDPRRIRWRIGSVSSLDPPPVILTNLPVCGNCHSFPRDGSTLAMDVDYANSKASYVIARIAEDMVLATSDIITWNDYRKEDGEQTFGLLSQISPDGRYVISTVKDKSVFVPQPDLSFSQLFFPIKGILVVYDRVAKTFAPLPGADDPAYVQSNPSWSPDGKHVVFARSAAYDLGGTRGKGKVLLSPDECKEFVQDRKLFQFDLYRVPFDEGRGGAPEPLAGASKNGMSNFFAKYSPDGKWIVFCKARSYMLLQPDTELHIIPAEGGEARRLACNTSRMNSWHSWSPNGKWLVFSSKANSAYTQLFLTHIDDRGESSPSVLLDRFTAPDRAANIPEFLNAPAGAVRRIREEFLNDYSFQRAGNEFFRRGKVDDAIRSYREAVRLNPQNADAHQRLGLLLFQIKDVREEGLLHTRKALELDPRNGWAHYDLAMALAVLRRHAEADGHFAEALRLVPAGDEKRYDAVEMRFNYGRVLLELRKFDECARVLAEAVRLAPRDPRVLYYLAVAEAHQGAIAEPERHYAAALEIDPGVDRAPAFHDRMGMNYAREGRFAEALGAARKGLELARLGGLADLARQIEARIALYERGQPPPPESP